MGQDIYVTETLGRVAWLEKALSSDDIEYQIKLLTAQNLDMLDCDF